MISSSESKESKFFQKAISVFLSALLVVAFIPAVAFADVSDNAGYASSKEDGEYKVDISGSTVIDEDNSGAGEGANTDNSQNNIAGLAGNETASQTANPVVKQTQPKIWWLFNRRADKDSQKTQ